MVQQPRLMPARRARQTAIPICERATERMAPGRQVGEFALHALQSAGGERADDPAGRAVAIAFAKRARQLGELEPHRQRAPHQPHALQRLRCVLVAPPHLHV